MDVLPAGAIVEDDTETEIETSEETVDIADDSKGYIFTVTEGGYGKKTPVAAYPTKHRGGYGVIDIKTERYGKVAGMAVVFDQDQLLLISEQGMILRMPVASIPSKGRNIHGVRIVKLEENDRVVAAVKVVERESEDGGEPEAIEAIEEETNGTGEEPVH
jgi:DNA gyrase subunit A